MLANTNTWVLVGLVIFLAVLWKFKVPGMVAGALDNRGRRIATELAEASRLRAEAEALLAEFESKRRSAEKEAEAIVAAAREEAERLAREADVKMADFVARRTKAAEQKIAQAEAQAIADVRAASAEAAAKAAETLLRAQGAAGKANDWLGQGLAEVKAQLN